MASRRLKSDRFFTDDYGPEIYTEFGVDYIKKNSMVTVLKRHFPQLAPALSGVENALRAVEGDQGGARREGGGGGEGLGGGGRGGLECRVGRSCGRGGRLVSSRAS